MRTTVGFTPVVAQLADAVAWGFDGPSVLMVADALGIVSTPAVATAQSDVASDMPRREARDVGWVIFVLDGRDHASEGRNR
jgi:hypothetical protein